MVAKIFIDGEAGTTGLQIRERLAQRRDIELLSVPAERRKEQAARAELLNAADIAILCLPDDAAKESVSLITNDTTRVIDASTAHRIDPDWAYGFAEMSPQQAGVIAAAKRVANPGCYPQGVIATVRPLIEAGLVPADYPFSVSAISGYSGGGRKMIEAYEADADPSPFAPYGLNLSHKHLPEMKLYSSMGIDPVFMPSVGNYAQGMVTMVPLQLSTLPGNVTVAMLYDAIRAWFRPGGFVEVAELAHVDKLAGLDPRSFNGTNGMRLHVFGNDQRRQAVLVAVYDNLGKGASGAAVQNMNLLLGCDEAESLAA
ncbi:N-acetyl-gamma-glutamyl-phosphate reductase [Breoghania corrubedonensis]|uniref:N-acetyl-gamma-glutamyl-phosphate reductase n=1 Tax=Breoghania corrubedonensis TaxID=665038 RepID=A0A2T5VAX0_9HYPH|nr:N-acetyl-gamma-glutamyl-phosphate reductase [Breoghania corrubedonensis]PTW60898.1 N-acetyl-gamma-glutamyl-phosphate reductase [Breoghania corrubedonensis]